LPKVEKKHKSAWEFGSTDRKEGGKRAIYPKSVANAGLGRGKARRGYIIVSGRRI